MLGHFFPYCVLLLRKCETYVLGGSFVWRSAVRYIWRKSRKGMKTTFTHFRFLEYYIQSIAGKEGIAPTKKVLTSPCSPAKIVNLPQLSPDAKNVSSPLFAVPLRFSSSPMLEGGYLLWRSSTYPRGKVDSRLIAVLVPQQFLCVYCHLLISFEWRQTQI